MTARSEPVSGQRSRRQPGIAGPPVKLRSCYFLVIEMFFDDRTSNRARSTSREPKRTVTRKIKATAESPRARCFDILKDHACDAQSLRHCRRVASRRSGAVSNAPVPVSRFKAKMCGTFVVGHSHQAMPGSSRRSNPATTSFAFSSNELIGVLRHTKATVCP